jgi:hypothetical protein
VTASIGSDIADAILHALGSAVLSGLAHLAAWAIAGVVHAVVATTSVDPATVMAPGAGPWRAMVTVAAVVAVPILLVAVAQAALRGEPAEMARRGLGVPLAVGVGLVAAQALLSALLAACSWASAVLVSVGAGGEGHLAQVWGRLGAALGSSGELATSAAGMPGAASGLLLLVAALAALTVWVELAVRAALLYLLGALVPLALAGLFWRRLASWAVRLGEVILAVALSQVVITAALVVGTSVVDKALQGGQAPGVTIGGLLAGIGLLLLASLGLPITLGVVPIAVDAAVVAGAGRSALGAARHHAEGVQAALREPATASVSHRLATAPGRAVRRGVELAAASGAVPAAAAAGTMLRRPRPNAPPQPSVGEASAAAVNTTEPATKPPAVRRATPSRAPGKAPPGERQ